MAKIADTQPATILVLHTGERIAHFAVSKPVRDRKTGEIVEKAQPLVSFITLVFGPNVVRVDQLPPAPEVDGVPIRTADWAARFFDSPEAIVCSNVDAVAATLRMRPDLISKAQNVQGMRALADMSPALRNEIDKRIQTLRK